MNAFIGMFFLITAVFLSVWMIVKFVRTVIFFFGPTLNRKQKMMLVSTFVFALEWSLLTFTGLGFSSIGGTYNLPFMRGMGIFILVFQFAVLAGMGFIFITRDRSHEQAETSTT